MKTECPKCGRTSDIENLTGGCWFCANAKTLKECPTCGTTKESSPTPDGDEICPSCGDREMMDLENGCGQKFETEVYVENGWHKTCIVYCGNQDYLCSKCRDKDK
jgi:hypothetical protein